jgi:hypothetical protein
VGSEPEQSGEEAIKAEELQSELEGEQKKPEQLVEEQEEGCPGSFIQTAGASSAKPAVDVSELMRHGNPRDKFMDMVKTAIFVAVLAYLMLFFPSDRNGA